jgi:hypothetical protein
MMIIAVKFNKEQIIETTVENLRKGGIITESEIKQTKENLSALPVLELLATMVESHELKEFAIEHQN